MIKPLLKTTFVSSMGGLTAVVIFIIATILMNPRAPHVEIFAISEPINLNSSNAQLIVGQGFYNGEQILELTQLTPTPASEYNIAVLSSQPDILAEAYPFLYLDGVLNRSSFFFSIFWRSSAAPDLINTYPLKTSNHNVGWIQLAGKDGWTDRILEFGFIVRGGKPETPIRFPVTTLHDNSLVNALSLTWNDWIRITSPTQSSINAISRGPHTPYVSITFLGAMWAFASIIICFLAYRRRPSLNNLCIQLVIPWLCMDLLWSREFVHQTHESMQKFRANPHAPQYLEDPDAALAQYAVDVKKTMVDQGGKRIFIVHPSLGHNFERLRLQFHLLPLNIYNFGRFPPTNHLKEGDFLLIFNTQRIKYRPKHEVLVWGKRRLRVNLFESNDTFSLYKVRT